jgi:hypothetical protein
VRHARDLVQHDIKYPLVRGCHDLSFSLYYRQQVPRPSDDVNFLHLIEFEEFVRDLPRASGLRLQQDECLLDSQLSPQEQVVDLSVVFEESATCRQWSLRRPLGMPPDVLRTYRSSAACSKDQGITAQELPQFLGRTETSLSSISQDRQSTLPSRPVLFPGLSSPSGNPR